MIYTRRRSMKNLWSHSSSKSPRLPITRSWWNTRRKNSGRVLCRPCRTAGFKSGNKTTWRARKLCLCRVLLAVVMILLNPRGSDANTPTAPSSPEQRESTAINRNINSTFSAPQLTVSRIPFLGKDLWTNEVQEPGPVHPRWLRVLSAKAVHPAMYVPADGLVYCPIAKVSTIYTVCTVPSLSCP